METFCIGLVAFSALLWVGFALLPWRPWSNQEVLDVVEGVNGDVTLTEITVLIPARNEAGVIQHTLQSVIEQGPGLKIVLIDDSSEDATVEKARQTRIADLRIIRSAPLPPAGAASFGPSNRAAYMSRLRIRYSSMPTLSWPEMLSRHLERRCIGKACHSFLSWRHLRCQVAGRNC
jgi:cellulose synthase/poly-beta-1,6-N-acetylglucosamine synthase-like glycosyltransferase